MGTFQSQLDGPKIETRHLLENLIQDPPKEDSEDLSDEEISQAVSTNSYEDLSKRLVEEIRRKSGLTIKGHELRRRGENLFWRTTLVSTEPDRVLLFRVNWLGGPHG